MSKVEDTRRIMGDRSGIGAPQPLNTIGTQSPSPTGQSPQAKPQGSGRFTNLQKYIQANQGAGEQIAGSIGKGVREEIGKEEREAGEYYKNLGSAISGANKVAKEGHKYQQTLKEIGENVAAGGHKEGGGTVAKQREGQNFGLQDFATDTGFKQFQNIQAGRGIDEDLLKLRQQQAARESGQYLDTAQQAQESLGSQGGRFNLLRQTFGGAARPGYTTGQQRLDQALLSKSGLGDLRGQVAGDVRSATEANRQAMQGAGEVGRLENLEQGLVSRIAKQNTDNELAYKQMLESYIDPTNVERQADWDSLQNSMKAYDTSWKGKIPLSRGLNQGQLRRLGIEGQRASYNVMDDLTADKIAEKGLMAARAEDQGYKDVANVDDVTRYAALAKIMGRSDAQRDDYLGEANTLGDAWTAGTGDRSLSDMLDTAQTTWDKNLNETTIDGSGARHGGRNLFGARALAHATATGTAKDLLARGESGLTTSATGSVSGGKGVAATADAKKQAMQRFQQWLNEQGYGNTIGQAPSTGAKDQYVTPDPTTGYMFKK